MILKITWDSWRTVRAAKKIDLDHVGDAAEDDDDDHDHGDRS